MMATADWAIAHGDALFVLSHLPSGVAQCVVTSPPYYSLRDYSVDPIDWPEVRYAPMPGLPELVIPAMSANLGLEDTPEAYIAHLVAIFREVRRVLADTGVVWLNMGDSYSTHAAGVVDNPMAKSTLAGVKTQEVANRDSRATGRYFKHKALPEKNLMLIPARLALALQADGWWVRSEIVWAKGRSLHVDECGPGSTMPESVGDRPTKAHEMVYLLSKSDRYFYDAEAVAEPAKSGANGSRFDTGKSLFGREWMAPVQKGEREDKATRNLRDVWLINPGSFKQAHFATFPPELPDLCIRAGSSERGQCPHCGAPWERVVERTPMEIARSERSEQMGKFGRTQTSGTMTKPPTSQTVGWRPTCECPEHEPVPQLVIDPFSGTGTTGLVATRLGRRYIGIEPNAEYVRMSERRIIDDAPLFNLPAKVSAEEVA